MSNRERQRPGEAKQQGDVVQEGTQLNKKAFSGMEDSPHPNSNSFFHTDPDKNEREERDARVSGWLETTFSLQHRLSGPHQGSTQSVCQTKVEGSVGRGMDLRLLRLTSGWPVLLEMHTETKERGRNGAVLPTWCTILDEQKFILGIITG